jgi:PAS domain S-box-containing protein
MSIEQSQRGGRGSGGSSIPLSRLTSELLPRLVEGVEGYALVLMDERGRISRWPAEAEHAYGFSAEEILDQPYARLYPADDVERGLPQSDLAAAAESGQLRMARSRLRADGTLVEVRATLLAITSSTGSVTGYAELSTATSAAVERGQAIDPGEQPYHALFDNNPNAVLSIDRSGLVVGVNAACQSVFGADRVELVGQEALRLFGTASGGSPLATALARAWAGEPIQTECSLRRADGVDVELGLTLVPAGAEDEITRVFAIGRDITGTKQRERKQLGSVERLGTERARLAAVVRQMPAGVVIAEAPSGRILLGNHQLERILLHPVMRSQSDTGYDAWKGFRADGRPLQPDEWPLTRAIRYGETVTGEEIEYERGDGSRIWLRIHASPIRDAHGRVVAGVAIFDDIEEEKRAEAGMRFLAEASSVLTGSLDYRKMLNKLARLAVPRFADWCVFDMLSIQGVPHRQETAHGDPEKQKLLRELQRRFGTDYNSESHPIGRVFRSGEPLLLEEVTPELLRSMAPQDDHRTLVEKLGVRSMMIVPLQGRQRVLGVFVFGTAESGRHYRPPDLELAIELARRSTAALENAELFEAASAASEAKSNFLAVVSHELRTPLNAITGYTELLLMGVPDPIPDAASAQVRRIRYSAEHLRAIVEEILTFTRVEAGTERVHLETVDLRRVLDEVVTATQRSATEKGLVLHLLAPDSPWRVETDAGKVKRILSHLLGNAVKFTETGKVELAAYPDGDVLVLEVRDTGVGIEARHLEKIFEPFWQIDSGRTRRYGGTGLGLSVARQLARLLGGEITVTSQPRAGTTFRITLPLSRS